MLASAGALAAGAGCSGLNPLAERDPLPRLGGVRMWNQDSVAHELSVRIERDDERLLAETYRLGSDESPRGEPTASITCGIGRERGQYTLSFETETGESVMADRGREHAPAFSVTVTISETGRLAVFGTSLPYERLCDDAAATPE